MYSGLIDMIPYLIVGIFLICKGQQTNLFFFHSSVLGQLVVLNLTHFTQISRILFLFPIPNIKVQTCLFKSTFPLVLLIWVVVYVVASCTRKNNSYQRISKEHLMIKKPKSVAWVPRWIMFWLCIFSLVV